jgi:Na+-transporting NADH:ubiquinone oxidoreductase subunit NqrC
MKLKSKIKEQKGSITLFVLTSMLFFVIVVVAVYVNTNYKAQAQQRELEKIQQTYQKEDINDIYLEHKQ